MGLIDQINQDIKQAMLAREKEKLEALRAVKSALLMQQTEKGASGPADDETGIVILKRLVKQRKESAAVYEQQGRDDLAEVEKEQAKFIEVYLPEQLSDDKIEEIVKKVIAETGASGIKDMGKVMGQVTKEIAGKADNKKVSEMVKKLLA